YKGKSGGGFNPMTSKMPTIAAADPLPQFKPPSEMTPEERAKIGAEIEQLYAPRKAQLGKNWGMTQAHNKTNKDDQYEQLRDLYKERYSDSSKDASRRGAWFGTALDADKNRLQDKEDKEGRYLGTKWSQIGERGQSAYDDAMMAVAEAITGETGIAIRGEKKDKLDQSRWLFGAEGDNWDRKRGDQKDIGNFLQGQFNNKSSNYFNNENLNLSKDQLGFEKDKFGYQKKYQAGRDEETDAIEMMKLLSKSGGGGGSSSSGRIRSGGGSSSGGSPNPMNQYSGGYDDMANFIKTINSNKPSSYGRLNTLKGTKAYANLSASNKSGLADLAKTRNRYYYGTQGRYRK
ncbi:hypothetical protein LCGC14_1900610, partial [marine sediment metagenome]